MENFRATLTFLLLQSYTLITLAASLPFTLSINNANISLASSADSPVNNTLHLPSGPYIISNSQGNITIDRFDGAFVQSVPHTYYLWRMFDLREQEALAEVLNNSTLNPVPLRWDLDYATAGRYHSEIRFVLHPLPRMTYEHMLWAMKALKNWVVDKTVEMFDCFIDAEGVGRVGIGQVTRIDEIPDADE